MKDKVKKWWKKIIGLFTGKSSFLKEGTKDSIMRYMCLMLVRASIYIPVLCLVMEYPISWEIVTLSGTFAATGITGKAQQKKSERINDETTVPDNQDASDS